MPGGLMKGLHHLGTFCLFTSFVLMLVVSISAPRVNSLGLLRVNLLQNETDDTLSSVSYGSFGWCVLDARDGRDHCSGSHIGYKIASIQTDIDDTSFSRASRTTLNGLTNVMVLHPIACALAFIAFAFALGAGVLGSLLASITALLTWLIVFITMVIDFIVFGTVKDHVNGHEGQGNHARFGAAMWLVLASFILLIFASIDLFLSCCARRRERKADKEAAAAARASQPKKPWLRNPFKKSTV